ncbi:G5 domain-containing protein, partial [Romboutsia ilealis]|uniref:G5 domain-containing protein n=1 Tax=Romboutsia ilealis TaxID=1115758 RepID=UPI0025734219
KELQEIQRVQTTSEENYEPPKPPPKSTNVKKNFTFHFHRNNSNKNSDLKLSHIIVGCGILIVGLAVLFPKNTSFTQSYAKEDTLQEISEYELNRHRLNIQSIISENADMDRVKEQVTEEREIEFMTEYNNNPTLPKGEEIIEQEGTPGKENVTAVKTYESGNFVEEIILSKEKLVEPISKIVNIGTSEFLAKHKVHIGDIMYLVTTDNLKETPDISSNDVAEVKNYLDVKLLELPSEEWCKVSFDNIEGYIKTSNLTSSYTMPNIIEKNRIQRILIKINLDMELNRTSGLTLNDYKKIFTNLPNDKNKIFQDNYTAFYNAEKKYNINGIFLASIAIHESGWGTSQIAMDKKNLFGYGSYDATPYESSFEFENYVEGIETVAKSLVKYYLNPSGTKIYDGETAAAWYYNGPTLKGVNTRYASDPEWHEKVYNYMETLYNRLQ